MGSGIMTPPQEPDSPVDGILRKRVCKACDRCRLKKSKCDGNVPCSRCKVDNAICVFGERKKSHDKVYPKGYVEMLENQQAQLVTGLQELYRRLRAGEEWSGEPLKESSNGTPLTHDILEYLGALKQEGHPSIAPFEENLELLQRKLIANGSGSLQREQTFDSMSDADSSPTTEQVLLNKYPMFSNPFANSVFPPTPPSASPHLRLSKTGSPLKEHFSAVPQYYNQSSWPQMPNVNESFDFSNVTYDTSMMDVHYENTFDGSSFSATAMAINPCMTMKNWPLQDEHLQQYFQTSSFS